MKNSTQTLSTIVSIIVSFTSGATFVSGQQNTLPGPASYSWSTSTSSFSSTLDNVSVMDALISTNTFSNQPILLTRTAVDLLNSCNKRITLSISGRNPNTALKAIADQAGLKLSVLKTKEGKTIGPVFDTQPFVAGTETFRLTTLLQNAALDRVMAQDLIQVPIGMVAMNMEMRYGIRIKIESAQNNTFGSFPSSGFSPTEFPKFISVRSRGMTVRDCLKEIAKLENLRYKESEYGIQLSR